MESGAVEDWAEVTFDLQKTGNESTLHHGENVGETMFSRFLWLPHLMHTHLAVLFVSLMTSDALYSKRGTGMENALQQNKTIHLGNSIMTTT